MAKIYVIGSMTCEFKIKQVAEELESLGHEVRYIKQEDNGFVSCVRDCFLTIENWADAIVVVPKSSYSSCPKLDIGHGTTYEMEHAKSYGKPVYIYAY